MEIVLPEDVLHLLCDELHLREDLSTLFNLAVTSRSIAPLALSSLYRTGNQSPADDELSIDFIAKWSVYWRSITLASLGQTLYPYNLYLRFLDLRDLGNFLDAIQPGGKIDQGFFGGLLAQFRHLITGSQFLPTAKYGRRKLFDKPKIVNDIGATIALNAPMIEVISGKISPKSLEDWASRLSRLQRLELEEGNPLGEEAVRKVIYQHCPNFSELEILHWFDSESDAKLGRFFSGLPANSLKGFTAIGRCGVSIETCLALNHHGESLRMLAFGIEPEAIPGLALLGGCVALETFKLEASSRIVIADTHKEVLEDFSTWLGRCERLRDIQLLNFNNAPAALTPLLLNGKVRLESVTIKAFSLSDMYKSYHSEESRIFHQALLNQSQTLQSLDIKAQIHDGEEPSIRDAELFVNTIRQLTNLTSLNLMGIMDESFGDETIIRLVTPLKRLEDVSFGGYAITDEVLLALSTLRELKRITVLAGSRFTLNGILEFVSKLGIGNEGLALSLDNADYDYQLSEEDIALVSSRIDSKVNGTFYIQVGRDPHANFGDNSDSDYDG